MLSSLKSEADVSAFPPKWIFTPTAANYEELFGKLNAGPAMLNSFLIVTISTLLAMIMGTMAAYALARFSFKGKETFALELLSIRMLPAIVSVIPLFIIARSLGVFDTPWLLIAIYALNGLPFVVWVMRVFIQDVPKSIEEAAMIDGCGRYEIFFRITLPLVLPGLAAVVVIVFMFSWNEYLFASMLTSSRGQDAAGARGERHQAQGDLLGPVLGGRRRDVAARHPPRPLRTALPRARTDARRGQGLKPMSIEVRGLSKRFGGYTAVQGLDIEIADGEFFVLLGPSGCGKSTTLRMIAGLDMPSSGTVRIRGRDVTYAEPRHRDIAMVFQDYGLYPNMTVFQNIEFPLKVRKLAVPERRRKVLDTAERLGIAELLDRKPGKISGGQRQRVSLARALVRSPHAFLMDEPLSNLDASLRASMRTEIKQLVVDPGDHDRLRDPRPDRGHVDGRPHRRHESRRDDPGRQAASGLRQPPHSVRGRVSRLAADESVRRRAERRWSDHLRSRRASPICCRASSSERAADLKARGLAFFVGIRPEHLSLTASTAPHAVSAEVEFVEPLGQTTSLHLKAQAARFMLVTGRTNVVAGETVSVVAMADHVRVIEASHSVHDKN